MKSLTNSRRAVRQLGLRSPNWIIAPFVLLIETATLRADDGTNIIVPSPASVISNETSTRELFGYFLTFFFLCYLVQAIFAFRTASATKLAGSTKSLVEKVFVDQYKDTWVFIVITFLLSIGITLISTLLHLIGNHQDGTIAGADILWQLSVQNLLVLITLEVSYLHEVTRRRNMRWIGLMLAALVIDLLVYMLLSGAGEPTDRESKLPQGASTIAYLAITFLLSFIGSASVILFAREDI